MLVVNAEANVGEVAKGNEKTQSHVFMCFYLTASDWEAITDNAKEFMAKVRIILKRALMDGVIYPDEETLVSIVATCAVANRITPTATQFAQWVAQARAAKKDLRKSVQSKLMPMKQYPQDVSVFLAAHGDRYDADDQPVTSKIDHNEVRQMVVEMPWRITHSSLRPSCMKLDMRGSQGGAMLPLANGVNPMMQQLASMMSQALTGRGFQPSAGGLQPAHTRLPLALQDGSLYETPPPPPGGAANPPPSVEQGGATDTRRDETGDHTKPKGSPATSIDAILKALEDSKQKKRDRTDDADSADSAAAAKPKRQRKATGKAKAEAKKGKSTHASTCDVPALKKTHGFVKGCKDAAPKCPSKEDTMTWNGIRIYVKPAQKYVRCVPFGLRYDVKFHFKGSGGVKGVWPDVIKYCRDPAYPSHFDKK